MTRLAKIYLGTIIATVVLHLVGWDFLQPIARLAQFTAICLTIFFAVRFSRRIARKFLWRIRRKLVLSYIFIGFIPVLLLMVLFLLGLFIFMGQTTSEMFNSALDGFVIQTKNQSEKLLHLTEWVAADEAVTQWYQELNPDERNWLQAAEISLFDGKTNHGLQGGEPVAVPGWSKARDFSGLVLREGAPWLASVHHHQDPPRTIQILVPVNSQLMDQIKKKVDADVDYLPVAGESARKQFNETVGSTDKQPIWPRWWDLPVWWLSLPDQSDWQTGRRVTLIDLDDDNSGNQDTGESVITMNERDGALSFETNENRESKSAVAAFSVSTNISRVYKHIFARSTALQKFVYALMVAVAIFFLIIELLSFISGFLLARSITASVHNLFEGTERIRTGDLSYRIKVSARDQLGDLATSFNQMTESIQDLLKVRAEKERLAESLRIARQMQQNLLPKQIASLGGIDIAAMNLPAQEMCGDYYDFIRSNDREVGVIIADVSGKGPSAALYMAEVKGVILSISQRKMFPRELLVEANEILGPTLDARSFITMTYAIINEPERLVYISRAGHNPLLHYCAGSGQIEVVQPRGIGLGLSSNGVFAEALEEVQRKLCTGDILVLYTDGLTEAMNEQNQLYGQDRLAEIIRQNSQRSTDEMKSAIVNDLQRFLNHGLPQDDITLVLLKVR